MSSDDEYLPSTDPKDPNEKFISYLPHSGFHNQRTALVNALFVAKNLGRTLLVPPVVLGDSVGWKEFDELLATYQNTDKSELSECKEHLQTYYSGEQERENLPDKCQASYKYTSLRWDRMFNMTRIKQTIAVRYRDDYKDSTLENAFGISSSDTYFVKDSVLYDYSITDKPDWPLPQKYQRTIYLGDLGSRRERLISFGSMFGSGRVQVSNPESISLQQFLANQFILSRETLPELFQEADAIIRQLGGPKTYMSIHARVGESIFEHMSSQTMTKLWKDLQKYAPFVQSRAPQDEPIIPGTSFLDRTTCFAPPTDPSAMAVDWSTRQVASGRPLVFFMATDATDPRHHPLFQSIYNGFTCVVTLADVFDYRTSSLHNLVNPFDGLRYGRFLVPLLDGLVASRAQEFTGSSWSTFGFYIRFLHDTFILSQVS
ncbi:hypothetical protein F4703DRAFT_1731294 [Phycomyces blakesleeanus]